MKAGLATQLGEKAPRLISIACPFGNTMVFCDGPFALAFTTLEPADDWTSGERSWRCALMALRYQRSSRQ